MVLPLYQSDNFPDRFNHSEFNAGLWFDKFCNLWEEKDFTLGTKKGAWIQTVCKKMGNETVLQELENRRKKLVKAQNGVCSNLKLKSRLIVGMGNSNPIENGLTWHPTLGVPFIPGSSVKGMVLAWSRLIGEHSKVEHFFGKQESVGDFIFLDAFPISKVELVEDIMTPHYSEYYQSTSPEIAPPADWYSPTPISFLAVEEGCTFLFSIVPRTSAITTKEIETAQKLLLQALEWIGSGAKTASGYGRFGIDEEKERKELEQKQKELEEEKKANASEGDLLLDIINKMDEKKLLDEVAKILSPKNDFYSLYSIKELSKDKENIQEEELLPLLKQAILDSECVQSWKKGNTKGKNIPGAPGGKKLKEYVKSLRNEEPT